MAFQSSSLVASEEAVLPLIPFQVVHMVTMTSRSHICVVGSPGCGNQFGKDYTLL